MRYLKHSLPALSITILITTILAAAASPQSGRGRPKVPQPSPANSQPQPINVPAAAAVINQEQAGTTSRFVLRNGMTVIVSEQHAAPLAAAVAYFKAGLLDDPGPASAVARLVQHMMLKGTALRPADRAVAELRSLGASIEANTSYDGACFSVLAPSDKINDALTILADILQNSSLDGEALAKAVPLVINEERREARLRAGGLASRSSAFTSRALGPEASRLMTADDPAAYSMARVVDLAFNGGTLANLEALRSMTREQIAQFYRSHYRPDNLIVSVVGDVPTFNTLVEIQQLFGGFGAKAEAAAQISKEASSVKTRLATSAPGVPAASSANQQKPAKTADPAPEKPPPPRSAQTTEQERLRYAVDRADTSQSIVSAAFHAPGAESKEWPAIEVLTAVAGMGRASRLSSALIDGSLAATRIEANYAAVAGAGLLIVQVWPATDSREGSAIDKAESAMFKEMDRLRREIPTDGEIARARAMLEKRFVDESSRYLGRADLIARAEGAGVGYRAALDYRTRIRAVRADDVQRAAAKYLTLANTSIHEYEPVSAAARTFDANTFAATVTAWAPGFAQPVESAAVQPADARSSLAPVPQGTERSPERQAMIESVQALPVKDFSTLNGPKAFVREDHSQQKVTVALLFQGGRLIEDLATSGTTELMLRSILYGTPRRTFSQVTQELEQLGADVRIVAELDFFGFMLSALSRNADRALKLLRDSIEEPAFRNEDIARARLGQIASIRDGRDSAFARSRELLFQALFPGHPHSLPPHGREEVIAALTSEKLGEWHTKTVKRLVPVAIIVGDTDGSALVSSQIAEGFKRRDVDSAIQVKRQQAQAAVEKSEQRRAEQTNLAVGFPGPRAESADVTIIQLIESAMNGLGGSLLRDLRDKDHLISTAALADEAMFAEGAIYAQAEFAPENEQRVRAGLLAQFERLARGELTSDELAAARALAATSRVAFLQSQSQHALEYARMILYQRQASDVDSYLERAAKVTVEDIKRVASTYFKPPARAATVRGDSQAPPSSPPRQN